MSTEHETPGNEPPIHTGDDIPFDDFESTDGRQSLAEILRNNPMLKIGLIVAALAVVAGGMMLFGGRKQSGDAPVSVIKERADAKQAPGTAQVSDVYKNAVQEKNQADVEKAIQTGGSALPVPIAAPLGRVPINDGTTAGTEDPLERWRRMQEDRTRREEQEQRQSNNNAPAQQQAATTAQAVKELAGAMSTQMESVLSSNKISRLQMEQVTAANFLDPKTTANDSTNGTAGGAQNGGTQVAKPVQIIVPAGTIAYAQLVTQADSDVNGPVLAVLLGGPLSGDRVLGTFSKQNNFLILKFNTVVIDGIGHPTDGVAIDPSTNTQALATDVDHHYFDRIIIPAAASFIQGLGSAIAQNATTVSQSSSSTVTSSPKLDLKQQVATGISSAAQQAGSVLTSDAGQIQVTVKVAAGTTMGILFTKPVTDQTASQ